MQPLKRLLVMEWILLTFATLPLDNHLSREFIQYLLKLKKSISLNLKILYTKILFSYLNFLLLRPAISKRLTDNGQHRSNTNCR